MEDWADGISGNFSSISYQTMLDGVNTSFLNEKSPAVGSTDGEWLVLALARGGAITDELKNTYLTALNKTLADSEKTLSVTDYERIALAVTALGLDASSYGESQIDLTAAFKDYEAIEDSTQLNAKIFALLALNSKDYTGTQADYIKAILAATLENGGWNLAGDSVDVDTTAMAIQALAPYYTGVKAIPEGVDKEQLQAQVDKALEVLKGLQDEKTGGWLSMTGSMSTCSTAQVITALSALNIDAETWTTARKKTPLYALAQHCYSGKTVTYFGETSLIRDTMATEQAAYALVAYDRYVNQKNALYNITDAFTSISDDTVEFPSTSYVYNGKAQEPEVTVKDGETPLVKDTDYTVSYSNNTDVGTATVTITGKGSYIGEIQKTFEITKAEQAVTASVTPASVVIGKTAQVSATGEGTLTYESSDKAIATVDAAGKVTAVGVGKATITVKASGNANYKEATATCVVTVKAASNKVTISNSKASLTKNASTKAQSVQISAKKTGGSFTYTSSDKKVTVSKTGKVSIPANYVGTVKITVKAGDSTYETASATATIKVNAIADTMTVSNLAKDAKTTAQTYSFKVTRKSSGKLSYSSNNTAVTVKNGKVVIAKNFIGKATITVKEAAAGIYKASSTKFTVTTTLKGTKLSTLTNVKGQKMTVKWAKNASVAGYQIQYSTDKNFKKNVKSVSVSKASTTSKTISGLKKGSKYYVRIRTNIGKQYSAWSTSKSVTIKK
jgi:uncharacterized protein YjdB